MLSILTFFTLNTQPLNIIGGFCLNLCRGNILCNCHELPVAVTRLVDFNRGYINAGDKDTEALFQPFADVILDCIVDLCNFAFELDHRNTVCCRCIGYAVFDIPAGSITNLLLEIVKAEIVQPMQLDKLSVIRNAETDSTSHGNRNTKIRKPRIIYIKEGDPEFYLNDLGKVDEINLCLKWCAPLVCQPDKTCKNGEVCCFKNLVKRTFNEVLHSAVLLPVYKNSDFSVLYPQRRTPSNSVFSVSLTKLHAGRMPFPDQIGWLITADFVHESACTLLLIER